MSSGIFNGFPVNFLHSLETPIQPVILNNYKYHLGGSLINAELIYL